MTEKEATSLLASQDEQGVAVLQFIKDSTYTTFRSEHAFDAEDIVFHFFRAPENSADKYWSDTFPNALSEVAQSVFNASYPRLKAAFTQETDSWWMRATGFANEGLPEERLKRFYAELDRALDAKNATV